MGHYTSIDLTLVLKDDTSEPMVSFLKDLCQPMEQAVADHEGDITAEDHYAYLMRRGYKAGGNLCDFIGTPRWSTPFWGDRGIRYKDPTFRILPDGRYELKISGGVKNHQIVIEKFLAWIFLCLDHKPGDKLGEWHNEDWYSADQGGGWADILYGHGQIHYKYGDTL